MSKKNKMSGKDAQRIQSTQDQKGAQGDKGFISRSAKAADKNSKSSKG